MDPSPRASDLETRYSYLPTAGKSIHVSTPVLTKPTAVVEPRPQSLPAESEVDLPESAPENEPTVDLMQQDLPVREAAAAPGSRDRTSKEENRYQFTRRKRRPPKKFTYDNLGSPSCYNVQIVGNNHYPHFASRGMTTVTPWSSPPLCYPQPSYVCY
ncbi:hypothetical protein G5714_001284 [Onychostoma macrolepis]|uniref:Uncharacterized protein n=1 Tax=Onychostoma macrolepis TaxID=369639 RepID=A0A7J6DC69_9TELE|nr:hypothetical protein G5714_001284 [Onychostoma macrolepis]